MTATKIAGAAVAAALALTLTACGGDDGPSGSATPEMGPIDRLWEGAWGDYDQEDADAEQLRIEELVAECMVGEGFEYTPVDYSGAGWAVAEPVGDDGEELQWGTLDFAKKYGYGQTTNPWGDGEPVEEGGEQWVDPNAEYTASMTDTERMAYEAALYGVQPDFQTDEEWENWNPSWEEQGCYGYASHEVYGDRMWGGETEETNEWADLEAEMEAMYAALESDSRVTEAVADWSACMADAGYPGLASIYDAEEMISTKVQAMYEDDDPYADLDENSTEEDWEAAQAEMDSRLSALTGEEIETAVADFTCREEVGYDRIYQEVNIDLQEEFYNAHKDELEAYVAAMTDY